MKLVNEFIILSTNALALLRDTRLQYDLVAYESHRIYVCAEEHKSVQRCLTWSQLLSERLVI